MIGFFVFVAFALAVAAGAYWWWRRKIAAEVAEGAAIEWAHYRKTDPEFLEGVSEEKFREVYARVHTPRFPGYALAMAVTFFASLPVTFAALVLFLMIGEKLGLAPAPIEIVQAVNLGEAKSPESWQCNTQCQLQVAASYAGFYYFFGMLASWLLIVAFFMRRFHARRPGYIRDEIIRARE